METIAIPKLVAIVLPLMLAVTHALTGLLFHRVGHRAGQKKSERTLQHYWDTMGGLRKEIETGIQEHADLQHAHNTLKQNAGMQLRESAEKLAASEHLRDDHARRVATLEEENAGLHKILTAAAETAKTVRRDTAPRSIRQRGRPAADK